MNVGSIIKNYKILDELRPGAGGSVYVVEDMNAHKKFVLKSSYLEESKKAQFENIVTGWKDLSSSCKNVVKFKEVFYQGTKSYVVMEYCTDGDLESIIKKMRAAKRKFTEAEISKIAIDVLTAVQAMHSINMIHRDLKTANILKAEDGTYKLADFNVSRVLSDDGATTMTFAGTMQYVAPELLQNKAPSYASDVYAVGAVLYELIALTPAFTGMDIPSVLANRYRPLDASLGYAAELTQLVHRMLALDPSARPSAGAVLCAPVFVRAQAEAAEGELRRQAVSLTALQQSVVDQLDTIGTLQRTVGEQQRRIDSLERTAREQQAKAGQQQTQVDEQQQKIDNLEKTVRGQQANANKQQANADQQQAKADQLQAALTNLQTTVEDLRRSVTAYPPQQQQQQQQQQRAAYAQQQQYQRQLTTNYPTQAQAQAYPYGYVPSQSGHSDSSINKSVVVDMSKLQQLSPDDQKQYLGELIYPRVHKVDVENAGKITGMLLELDVTELVHILKDRNELQAKILEAQNVLLQAVSQHQQLVSSMYSK